MSIDHCWSAYVLSGEKQYAALASHDEHESRKSRDDERFRSAAEPAEFPVGWREPHHALAFQSTEQGAASTLYACLTA